MNQESTKILPSDNCKLSTACLYSDGGSRGNPGNAGAGFVLYNEKKEEVFAGKKHLGIATNNHAEYMALILGLQKAKELGIKKLECFLDSELIVKQINGEYRVKHPDLKPLFEKVKELCKHFGSVTFFHIRRELNKRADALANEAMDNGNVQ